MGIIGISTEWDFRIVLYFGGLAGEKKIESVDSDMMSKEQSELDREVQESLEKFLMETFGKKPFQSLSRSGVIPVQWIHWLDAVDQQDVNKLSRVGKEQELDANEHGQEKNTHIDCPSSVLNGLKESIPNNKKETGALVRGLQIPSEHSHSLKLPQAVVAFAYAAFMANGFAGWPSLVPSNIQMIKCDKCCQEFCSSLNHRRHVRMHRRPLNVVKEDVTNEIANLAAFWDKLSSDMARQIVSFSDIMLQEVQGSLIIKALTSLMHQPGFPLCPKYLKAGAALLDVVQCKSSRFPLPAKDLFNILEDATEKTFLCTGVSVSEQRFVFEGETRKLGLEVKNLVASVGFLVEQRLVEAWVTGKNAEALRLQKELVEEEEIAQKRQAELLERKRLKKIKQKQLKEKDSTKDGNFSQLPVCSKYDSPSAVGYTCETQDAGHLGYNDTDLEQRDSQSLAPEHSLSPDQDEENKSYTEDYFPSGRRVSGPKSKRLKHKRSNQQTSRKAIKKSNVILKPLSGGNSLGPTRQGDSGVKQKGFDICPAETGNSQYGQDMEQIPASLTEKSPSSEKSSIGGGRIREDQSSMASALGAKGDDNLGNQSQVKNANDWELLFGSMAVCLSNFLNKPLSSMLIDLVTDSFEKSNTHTPKNMATDRGSILEEACNTEEIQEGHDYDVNDCENFRTFLYQRWEDAIADTEAVILDLDSGVEEEAADFEGEDVIGEIQSVGVLEPDTEATVVQHSGCCLEQESDETQAIGVPDPDTETTIVQHSDCGVEHASDETRATGVPDPDFDKDDAIGKAQSAGVLHPDTEASIVQDSDCDAENASNETQAIGVPDPDFEGEDAIGKIQSVGVRDPDVEATTVRHSDCGVQHASDETQAIHVPDPHFEEEDVIDKIQSVGVLVPDLSVKDTAAETQTIFGQDGNSGLEIAATETHITVAIEDPDVGVLEDPDSSARVSIPGDSAQVYCQDRDSSSGEVTCCPGICRCCFC